MAAWTSWSFKKIIGGYPGNLYLAPLLNYRGSL
jgi:hypothetical protein